MSGSPLSSLTSAPHAILRAAGGTVTTFHQQNSRRQPVLYHQRDEGASKWKNATGLVVCGARVGAGSPLALALDRAIESGMQKQAKSSSS